MDYNEYEFPEVDATKEMLEFTKAYNFWRALYTSRNSTFRRASRCMEIFHNRMRLKYTEEGDSTFDLCYITCDMGPRNHWNISDKDIETIKRMYNFFNEKIMSNYPFYYDMDLPASEEVVKMVSRNECLDCGEEPFITYAKFHGEVFEYHKGVKFANVLVNFNEPDKAIFEELRLILAQARSFNLQCSAKVDMKMPYPDFFTASGQGGYSRTGDKGRAIGLWLWDHLQNRYGSVQGLPHGAKAEALRAFKKGFGQGVINSLQCAATESRVFQNWLARTDACIKEAKVLSFSPGSSKQDTKK